MIKSIECKSPVQRPDMCECIDVCKYAAWNAIRICVATQDRFAPNTTPQKMSTWPVEGREPSALMVKAIESYAARNTKPSNPKDAIGVRKVGIHCVPMTVLWELACGMGEGGYKYGTHNYRFAGVRASVYFDACFRHLSAWWEGENEDPDSGFNHVAKAIASLTVLRDSMIQGNWVDDRPPSSKPNLLPDLNKRVEVLADKYPNPVRPYTQADLSFAQVKESAV